MSDLETRVRDALHADEIGWDDLRQPKLRVAPRSPRRWPTVLATAAAVAAVATVASVIALTGNGNSNGPAGSAPAYAGYVWNMTALTDRNGPIADAASFHAEIAFSDTAVSGNLAGATIYGHYQSTSHGYVITGLGFAGSAGTSAVTHRLQRVGHAFALVFMNETQGEPSPSSPAAVAAQVTGDHLALQANGITVQLSRGGRSQLSPIIDAAGYRWNVQALTDEHGRLTIPDGLHPSVGLSVYGYVLANDTINTIDGGYDLSSAGYVITRSRGQSGEGYAGNDATIVRLRAAMLAIASDNAEVTATVDGDTMTLHTGAITMTLVRGAALPDELTVSGSGHGGAAPAPHSGSLPPQPAVSSSAQAAPVSSVAPATLPRSATSAVRTGRGAPGSHH